MKTMLRIGSGLALVALGGSLFLHAHAQEGGKKMTPPAGKVTPWEAIKIATAKTPGHALNANFEFEDGHWIYGVMVVNGKSIKEVEIDATTGKVGDTETVTPEGEGKEVTQELRAAIGEKHGAAHTEEKDEKE